MNNDYQNLAQKGLVEIEFMGALLFRDLIEMKIKNNLYIDQILPILYGILKNKDISPIYQEISLLKLDSVLQTHSEYSVKIINELKKFKPERKFLIDLRNDILKDAENTL